MRDMIIVVAVGYVVGRLVAHLGSILAAVVMRRLVEKYPWWQRIIAADVERDKRLKKRIHDLDVPHREMPV